MNSIPIEARIGPNAVTQLIPSLAGDPGRIVRIFASAQALDWLINPPSGMVDEDRAARVHQALRGILPPRDARAVLVEAGERTADYLLAHRIPKAAQAVLRCLPPFLAARLLVPAIRAHAWTFAGTGRFEAHFDDGLAFQIWSNPLCRHEHARAPVCDWHAAVFRRLFRALVSPHARVRETHCTAAGDACCRFEIDW